MRKIKVKAYFKYTLIFTLIFAIVALTGFTVAINMMDGMFLGYRWNSDNVDSYINVALLGVDKGGTRTDVIILAQMNLVDNSVHMLQIPRDTYVADNGRGDRKINSAWGHKKEKTLFKELEQITGVELDKYVLVDTSQFREVIDTIDGIEYDVPINMDYDDPVQGLHIHLKKGKQTLNGDKAEQFVRFRQNNNGSGYARGDIERLEQQQGCIKAAIRQLFSFSNAFKAPQLVSTFSSMIETNYTRAEMLAYAPYIFKLNQDNVKIMTLPGEARMISGGSYYIHDAEETEKIIKEYFSPEVVEMNGDELKIMQEVIGLSSNEVSADQSIPPKKSWFNRFVEVDIIDASGGVADIEAVKNTLKHYGYKVDGVTSTTSIVNDKTQLIVKKDDQTGHKLANMMGMTSFVINKEKSNGTDVTVILGKDMS